jgi:hypothetical protein
MTLRLGGKAGGNRAYHSVATANRFVYGGPPMEDLYIAGGIQVRPFRRSTLG